MIRLNTELKELPQQNDLNDQNVVPHPDGRRIRILLTSVFGPYARNDEYGSRANNPMELYHNQVTREQGAFSLRMFHRSWGLMLIQANISAPTTVLDFPTKDRFLEELENEQYQVIGISSILVNIHKVQAMVRWIREKQPHAKIVVGGHIANLENAKEILGADIVVRGDGVRWWRQYTGDDTDAPVRHPLIVSGIRARNMGIRLSEKPGAVAATIIPSVGCPIGCNFCSTSAMFGGKGKFVNFYNTGEELYSIMEQTEQKLRTQSFFMMDENFLLHKPRAIGLLSLMEKYGKAWSLYVFSSASALKQYTDDQLVRLGIGWVWLGLEGEHSQYGKLEGTDTFDLVKRLQSLGIRVLGSTIIGLDEHTPENLDRVIDYAVRHDTDFHQFMLYTPLPGTPLWREHHAAGRMKDASEYDMEDIHGQQEMNYRHPHIPSGEEGGWLRKAFVRDFEVNGPSVLRIARTLLLGWQRFRNDPDERVRRRWKMESKQLLYTFLPAASAAVLWYREKGDHAMEEKMRHLRDAIRREFGILGKTLSILSARAVKWLVAREQRRLEAGLTYEPPTYYEVNAAMRECIEVDHRYHPYMPEDIHFVEAKIGHRTEKKNEPRPAP
ncbi:MAG: cobalamin-dependent protein, partial [Planctomycetia bacterium]|nr:cobalamin-dependent protein [Planctomycetia bacterium]